MHYIIYLTVSADNEDDAIEKITEWMNYESEYAGKQWDWWKIGGRYSGWLSASYAFTEDYKKVLESLNDKYGKNIGNLYSGPDWMMEKRDKYYAEANEWWYMNAPPPFGDNPSPVARDDFEHNGYSDDVLIVDKEMYHYILEGVPEHFQWRTEERGEFPSLRFYDLDNETPSQEFIGKKWIILVDAHI